MKTSVRRTLRAAALLAVLPIAAACGFSAQTDQVYQGANGPDNRAGEVDVLDAVVVSDGTQRGVFVGSFNNNSTDQAIKLLGVSGATVEDNSTPVTIAPDAMLDMASAKKPLVLDGSQIKPGGYVDLTFSFSNGQSTTMDVPVFAQQGQYAAIDVPTPAPSPKASPSADATPAS